MNKKTVYIIDDDDSVRKSISRSLQHHGYQVATFASGAEFLEQFDSKEYGCILLDVAMPGLSGLEVQSELLARDNEIPIIFMTGHGDVSTSVRAIKSGAIEFLEKPFSMDVLFDRLEEAFDLERTRHATSKATMEYLELLETLTKREKEVMAALVAGMADKSNKEVALDIGISHRTVEEYRSRIFNKMRASSITHLVEIAKLCGVHKGI